jgi:glucokinase
MDIGGTNLRIATAISGQLEDIQQWPCAELEGPGDALSRYLDQHSLTQASVCMAIASPIADDQIVMTNRDWSFSRSEFKQKFGLEKLDIINDFHAVCLSVTGLKQSDFIQIGEGSVSEREPVVVCGPGTGLGVATAAKVENKLVVLPGEGGHMDFAPNSVEEQKIWQIFHAKYDHVSYERILSGPGLRELYEALCKLEGVQPEEHSPAQISALGSAGESATCEKALNTFCAILGSFCGSVALLAGAFGGVYIAGGIAPQLAEFLARSDFRRRFEDKGRYQGYNQKIPTFITTYPYPGLLGAAQYLLSRRS